MTSIIYWSSFVTSRPTIHSSASELFRAARSGYSSQTGSLCHSNLYFCANFVRSSTNTAPYCSSSPRRRRRNAGERGAAHRHHRAPRSAQALASRPDTSPHCRARTRARYDVGGRTRCSAESRAGSGGEIRRGAQEEARHSQAATGPVPAELRLVARAIRRFLRPLLSMASDLSRHQVEHPNRNLDRRHFPFFNPTH
jgi:hypothetical protein